MLGGEQRIERNGDDAGTHGAPERHREVDGVVEQQRDPVLLPQAQCLQSRRELEGPRLQRPIGDGPLGIHERHLVAEAARHIGVDEIGSGVVGPALQEVVEHWGHGCDYSAARFFVSVDANRS